MSRSPSITLRKTRRRRRAFTLVELVAASTLMVVLFVLLAGVMRSIARQDRWTQLQATQHPQQWLLQQQISQDLSNARHMRITRNQISLFGALATNPRNDQSLQQDARVTYSIVSVAGKRSLVMQRIQKRTDGGQQQIRRVLWQGAASIQAEVFNEVDEEEQPEGDPEDEDPTVERIAGMEPMPARLELTIFDRNGQVLLRHNEVR